LANKANVGLAAEYDLVLTTGLIARSGALCRYSKSLFNQVTVSFSIQTEDFTDTLMNGSLIATLPMGFRPASGKFFVVYMHKAAGAGTGSSGLCVVSSNGNIGLDTTFGAPNGAAAVFGELSFLAR